MNKRLNLIQFIFLSWIFISCNNAQQESKAPPISTSVDSVARAGHKEQNGKQICWTGTLNNKTPVFIHYQVDSNVVVGEITYLNTKDKRPIPLLGTVEEDKSFRLMEFDRTGNITGIIEGRPAEREFNGSWVSPKTKRELEMKLLRKDTVLNRFPLKPDPDAIFGNYHYQYGETGYRGDFEFSKISNGKGAFGIISTTNVERGPNIAEVEKDTISFESDSFIYEIPDSQNCEFRVRFYKGFVYIHYTKGYCESQFGLNATIDGIYFKTN